MKENYRRHLQKARSYLYILLKFRGPVTEKVIRDYLKTQTGTGQSGRTGYGDA